MSSRQRISARDYKHGGRRGGGFDVGNYLQFFIGLGIGLAVAIGVFVMDRHGKSAAPAVAQKLPAKDATPAGGDPEAPVEQYDFYDMLPKFEVVLPEERNVRRDQPSVPVTQAGTYMIQAGSFESETVAQRQQQKLAKLGIDSVVQRVAIDADVKHRVRIGPISDLKRLNAIREQLRTADIAILLSRLPD